MSAIQEPAINSEEREIVSARTLDAPRDLLFRTFSDPALLAQWWGPKDFTNTIHEFDFRPGGAWRFVMHGPDGTDYPNKKEFIEVVPSDRIVLQTLEPIHRFRMTMTFEEAAGCTRLTWSMVFDSLEEAQKVTPFILEANEQNFDRLEALLASIS